MKFGKNAPNFISVSYLHCDQSCVPLLPESAIPGLDLVDYRALDIEYESSLSTDWARLRLIKMAQFVTELWDSVFTPGVTPALLKATYGAFVLLVSVLGILLFFTRSLHVLALLVISFCLIGSLLW